MSGDHNMYQKDIPPEKRIDVIDRLQQIVQRQEKDIEELTCACQLLLRRIKEMEDDKRRNPKALV
jgi:hypothetical protein